MSTASASATPDGDAVASALDYLYHDQLLCRMVDQMRAEITARIVDALTERSRADRDAEYWRAESVAAARAAGATWEQITEAMQSGRDEWEVAEVRALFSPRPRPTPVTKDVTEHVTKDVTERVPEGA